MTPALNIAAVIPARGGSKGIPFKNIAPLAGKPLLAYTIEAAKGSGVARDVIVTTDSAEIAAVAKEFGALVVDRPADIAHDTASTESALIHAAEYVKRAAGVLPDWILTLPPTSPFRTADTIRRFIDHFRSVRGRYDAMLSLTETYADHWVQKGQGDFQRLYPDAPRRRQERRPLFIENSAIYITRTETLLKTGSILGAACTGFVIRPEEALDINDPVDLRWAEVVMRAAAAAKTA